MEIIHLKYLLLSGLDFEMSENGTTRSCALKLDLNRKSSTWKIETFANSRGYSEALHKLPELVKMCKYLNKKFYFNDTVVGIS